MLEAGYNPAEQVPDICAVMALTGMALEGAEFETIGTPLLLAHGEEDARPVQCEPTRLRARESPKFFVTLHGEDHLSVFHGGDTPAQQIVVQTTVAFLDHYVSGEADALTRLQRSGDVPGVATLAASP